MLYMSAFKLSASVVETLNTSRSTRPACNAPCQVPVKLWASNASPDNAERAIVHSSNFFMSDGLSRPFYFVFGV